MEAERRSRASSVTTPTIPETPIPLLFQEQARKLLATIPADKDFPENAWTQADLENALMRIAPVHAGRNASETYAQVYSHRYENGGSEMWLGIDVFVPKPEGQDMVTSFPGDDMDYRRVLEPTGREYDVQIDFHDIEAKVTVMEWLGSRPSREAPWEFYGEPQKIYPL